MSRKQCSAVFSLLSRAIFLSAAVLGEDSRSVMFSVRELIGLLLVAFQVDLHTVTRRGTSVVQLLFQVSSRFGHCSVRVPS